MAQSEVGPSKYNGYGLQWYYFFVYILWTGVFILNTVRTVEKSFMLTVTAISLAYIPYDINSANAGSAYSTGISHADNLKLAGLLILVLTQYFVLFMFSGIEFKNPFVVAPKKPTNTSAA